MTKILCLLTSELDKVFFSKIERCLNLDGINTESSFSNTTIADQIDESYNHGNVFFFISIDHPLLLNISSNSNFFIQKFFKANWVVIMDSSELIKASNLSIDFRAIKYLLNKEMPPQLHLPVLRSLIASQKNMETKFTLSDMAKKLNKFLSNNLHQIEKIKKIHKRLVKFRSEIIRPFELNSRYAPGSASGGEFYDIFKGEHEILLVMTSSNNYQTSSSVISIIQMIKSAPNLSSNIEQGHRSLLDSFKKLVESDVDFNYLLMRGSLASAKISVISKGNFILVSNKPLNEKNKKSLLLDFFHVDNLTSVLDRGDRIVFLSPGIKRNINERLIGGLSLDKFIESKIDIDLKDLVNEVFFQIKNISKNRFLEYDATLITLEIEKNAILKI